MTDTEPSRVPVDDGVKPTIYVDELNDAATAPPCGVCARPAMVMATVPMCGERPRYPMCWKCFEDINFCDFAEDVVPL